MLLGILLAVVVTWVTQILTCKSLKLLGFPEAFRHPPGRSGNRDDANNNMQVAEVSKHAPGVGGKSNDAN